MASKEVTDQIINSRLEKATAKRIKNAKDNHNHPLPMSQNKPHSVSPVNSTHNVDDNSLLPDAHVTGVFFSVVPPVGKINLASLRSSNISSS